MVLFSCLLKKSTEIATDSSFITIAEYFTAKQLVVCDKFGAAIYNNQKKLKHSFY